LNNPFETKKSADPVKDRRLIVIPRRATELFLVPLALQKLPLLVFAHLLSSLLDYTTHVFTSLILIFRYIRRHTVFFAELREKHPKKKRENGENRTLLQLPARDPT
jgi:hypothetical protein